MAKLKWLKIDKFLQTAPSRLEFDDDCNVLVGKNSTGKSTLLDLVCAVLASDFSAYAQEPLQITYRMDSAQGSFTVEVKHVQDASSIPADAAASVGLPKRMDFSTFTHTATVTLHTAVDGKTITLELSKDGIKINDGSGIEKKETASMPVTKFIFTNIFRCLFDTSLGAKALNNPHLQLALNFFTVRQQRFDEALDYYRESHKAAVTIEIDKNGRRNVSAENLPRDFINWFQATPLLNGSAPDTINIPSKDLPSLAPIAKTLEFDGIDASLQILESEQTANARKLTYGKTSLKLRRMHKDNELVLADERLSFGQKRILAFGWYVSIHPNFIVADELVNGLHWAWINDCIDYTENRQSFLTSQNPLLLDFLRLSGPDQIEKTFIQCHWNHDNTLRFSWRNIRKEAANQFWESMSVGAMQPSELMRAHC